MWQMLQTLQRCQLDKTSLSRTFAPRHKRIHEVSLKFFDDVDRTLNLFFSRKQNKSDESYDANKKFVCSIAGCTKRFVNSFKLRR